VCCPVIVVVAVPHWQWPGMSYHHRHRHHTALALLARLLRHIVFSSPPWYSTDSFCHRHTAETHSAAVLTGNELTKKVSTKCYGEHGERGSAYKRVSCCRCAALACLIVIVTVPCWHWSGVLPCHRWVVVVPLRGRRRCRCAKGEWGCIGRWGSSCIRVFTREHHQGHAHLSLEGHTVRYLCAHLDVRRPMRGPGQVQETDKQLSELLLVQISGSMSCGCVVIMLLQGTQVGMTSYLC